MNPESTLKLQAYLDNELTPAEAQQVASWLANDQEARALFDELQTTKRLVGGNELEVTIPESREFYWSKIERAIALERTSSTRRAPWWFVLPGWWRRVAVPLVGTAALVLLVVVALKPGFIPQQIASYFHEIDTPMEEDDAISFHSQEAGMTVVWIAAR